jgi:hypothetical protein
MPPSPPHPKWKKCTTATLPTPIHRSTTAPPVPHRTASYSGVRRTLSYGGHDGYSAFYESADAGSADGEFVVGWSSGGDAANPRGMGAGRKWGVVLIVAASSLCV